MSKTSVARHPVKEDPQVEWERQLKAVTLRDAWPVMTRAWLERRRNPLVWYMIANSVHYARCQQASGRAKGEGA